MDLTKKDFAKAAMVGISATAPSSDDRKSCDLAFLGEVFSEVASQWKTHLGWKAFFDLEPSGMGRMYHLTVRGGFSSFLSQNSIFSKSEVLGMVCFRGEQEFVGFLWTTGQSEPSFEFEGQDGLLDALELYFSSFEVGRLLLKVFDKPESYPISGDVEVNNG